MKVTSVKSCTVPCVTREGGLCKIRLLNGKREQRLCHMSEKAYEHPKAIHATQTFRPTNAASFSGQQLKYLRQRTAQMNSRNLDFSVGVAPAITELAQVR